MNLLVSHSNAVCPSSKAGSAGYGTSTVFTERWKTANFFVKIAGTAECDLALLSSTAWYCTSWTRAVCVCVRVWVWVCVCMCVCVCVYVCVCVCVWKRERERECVCMCVCERERVSVVYAWGWQGLYNIIMTISYYLNVRDILICIHIHWCMIPPPPPPGLPPPLDLDIKCAIMSEYLDTWTTYIESLWRWSMTHYVCLLSHAVQTEAE